METKSINVLMVEDDARFIRSLRESLSALTGARMTLTVAETLSAAQRQLEQAPCDAILTCLAVTAGRGLTVFRALHAEFPALPIIVLADFDNEILALEAMRQGAQDYLVKSKFDGRMLARVIRHAIERKRLERRSSAQHAVTSALSESATLREAAPRILRAIGEGLEWPVGVLWQVDAPTDRLRWLAAWHAPTRQRADFTRRTRRIELSKGDGLPGRVWMAGEPVFDAVHADEESRFLETGSAEVGRRCSAVGFPVKVGRRIAGVMEFAGVGITQPDEELLRMMSTLGSQIGQFVVRTEAEQALAEERNLLRTLVDSLPDAIYVKDARSRFVLANAGVARLMGVDRSDLLVGKSDEDFHPRELARQYFADEQAVIQSGEPLINREELFVDSSGRQGWLLTTKAPLRDTRGRVVGIVGMGRDITGRKREEERHRLVEARLQAILDNTTAVIYLKDTEGRYLLINRQFEELFHVTRQQVVQQTDFDLFPPHMAQAFHRNDCQVLETRAPLEFEEVAPRDDEVRTYLSVKFPLCDTAGAPYAVCGISTDITERKRSELKLVEANLELLDMNDELTRSEEALRQALSDLQSSHEELRATQLQLIQAGKMESIGTLAAGVAHEVRNPLQTILMGLAYVGKNIAVTDGDTALALADMRDAVRRADAIVRDLLHLSAAKQLEVKMDDFNAVVEHSLWLVNYEITAARINVVRLLEPGLPRVRFDKAKMEQVFINLFMNAIQAMPHGGTLTARTSFRRWTNGDAAGGFGGSHIQPGDLVVMAEVEDTGVGIPPERMNRIFEPFFTTKPTGLGTGLGLPVTKQIIELHGGAIGINPGDSGGVRVTVVLKAISKGEHETKTHTGGG